MAHSTSVLDSPKNDAPPADVAPASSQASAMQQPAAAPPSGEATAAVHLEELTPHLAGQTWVESLGTYLASMVVHLVLFVLLAATLGTIEYGSQIGEFIKFDEVVVDESTEELDLSRPDPYDLSVAPDIETSKIDLTVTDPVAVEAKPARHYDDGDVFEEAGGGLKSADRNQMQLGGAGEDFRAMRPGVVAHGKGGLGQGFGQSEFAGVGGSGSGFGGRGKGHRDAMVGRYGGTKASERAVGAALNWLARHQSTDGSWSLDKFGRRCSNGFCGGHGGIQSDAAATALGLLPFLAAGQTHVAPKDAKTKGLYQENIRRGIYWLVNKQNDATGDLSAGSSQTMYTHGLATIALCEAYGMTRDQRVGYAAQRAIDFIQKAQSKQLGGWRYVPGDFDSDTSVVGWQLMALKSAQMAGLQVSPDVLNGVSRWLNSVQGGNYGGTYAYRPGQPATPTMTSVGLLCRQYLGAGHGSPILVEGTALLMKNPPTNRSERNIYYWYYATQVMHNQLGPDWDEWNRKMRRTLIETQVKGKSCATGSWAHDKPTEDTWGERGGRVMVTSLSCLTLEVYYRYLPLYDLDAKGANEPAEEKPAEGKPAPAKPGEAKPSAANPAERKPGEIAPIASPVDGK